MTTPTTAAPTSPIPSDSAELDQFVRELLASDESIAAFCRRTEAPPWKLYRTKQRLERQSAGSSQSERAELAPVRVVCERRARPIELLLAGGHRLVLTADFDEVALRRVLGVLASC